MLYDKPRCCGVYMLSKLSVFLLLYMFWRMSSCVLEIIQSVLQPRIYSTGFDSWDMPVSSKQMKNIFACASMFYLHSDWYFLIVMDVCKARLSRCDIFIKSCFGEQHSRGCRSFAELFVSITSLFCDCFSLNSCNFLIFHSFSLFAIAYFFSRTFWHSLHVPTRFLVFGSLFNSFFTLSYITFDKIWVLRSSKSNTFILG
jgi:hypothetical protein